MCWCERTPLEHRLYSARGGTGLCAACHEWTVDMLKRWFKPLTQYASCLLHGDRRKEDEDIAQEALFCCFKGVMNGSWSRNVNDGHEQFGPSLFKTVRHLCLNNNKKRQALSEADLDQALNSPVIDRRPEAEIEGEEVRRAVRHALLKLPPDFREVLVLQHQAGLSVKDISELLNIPEATVKSRAWRGRQALRSVLARLV